jgi:putative Holliday junction resolvase
LGRIIAIDYGRKRVGIATTDPSRIIATGVTTVAARETIAYLKAYAARETVDRFVVGHPKQMNNTDSQSMIYITPFLAALRRAFPGIPVELYDERFTSVLAHKALLEGGAKKKKRQDKAIIDSISATIILQSYLERIRNTTIQ